MKVLFIFLMTLTQAYALDFMEIDYKLKPSLKPKEKEDCVYGPEVPAAKVLIKVAQKIEDEKTIKVFPKNMETLGMSSKTALMASRDDVQTDGCSDGHDQGDMANRWCHSALARTFSAVLEEAGVSHGVASVAGGLFWAPKEFFYDLHPSSGDFVLTYQDKLGTKRSTFEITVYGDAFYKKRPFEHFEPFKESTPFITFRRKLGPADD